MLAASASAAGAAFLVEIQINLKSLGRTCAVTASGSCRPRSTSQTVRRPGGGARFTFSKATGGKTGGLVGGGGTRRPCLRSWVTRVKE